MYSFQWPDGLIANQNHLLLLMAIPLFAHLAIETSTLDILQQTSHSDIWGEGDLRRPYSISFGRCSSR